MTPEYLHELADLADPQQLWKTSGLDQMDLPGDKRRQLDTGIALRRYAHHLDSLRKVHAEGRSLLITPLSLNGVAVRGVRTPADHARLVNARFVADKQEKTGGAA